MVRYHAARRSSLPLGDVAVDGDLDEIRLHQRRHGADDDRDEGEGDLAPVRAQVLQQAPHEPRVVGLAENVVVRGHGQSIG
jgi:hypothetical protein